MKTKKQIANSTADALMLIKKAKEEDTIIWDDGRINQYIPKKGCGVLFKGGSGIIICGERRVDGNCFLCKRCLNEIEVSLNGKERMGMSSMGINLKDVWKNFELKEVCEKLGLRPNKEGELVK
jgi:hypothetical protein